MHTLTLRFKGLRWNGQMFRPQEIRFQREPEIGFEDSGGGTYILVDGKRYVWFCVPCEGWG